MVFYLAAPNQLSHQRSYEASGLENSLANLKIRSRIEVALVVNV